MNIAILYTYGFVLGVCLPIQYRLTQLHKKMILLKSPSSPPKHTITKLVTKLVTDEIKITSSFFIICLLYDSSSNSKGCSHDDSFAYDTLLLFVLPDYTLIFSTAVLGFTPYPLSSQTVELTYLSMEK